MTRFKDVQNSGPSKLVPFRLGETPQDRHQRRKSMAEEWEESLRSFCDTAGGLSLAICNNGHHWNFVSVSPYAMFVVEWWPSSAKLVIQRKYNAGIHTHDAVQVMKIIGPRYEAWKRENGLA